MKTYHRLLIFSFLIIAMSSCINEYKIAPPPPPPPVHVAARDFLVGEQIPDKMGAYGYLIFNGVPDSKTMNRYMTVCNVFMKKLEKASLYKESGNTEIMATFWMLDSEISSDQCAVLIQHYNYAKATKIAASINKSGVEGPLLVAWTEPFLKTLPKSEPLFFDLSNFSDDDIRSAFNTWKNQISQDPSFWNKGFALEKFRLELHNFLQRYGETIVSVVKHD